MLSAVLYIYYMFASGGTLLYAQKCAKGVKGTPLKNPDFTRAQVVLCVDSLSGTRSAKHAAFAPLARSCGENSTECAFDLECRVWCGTSVKHLGSMLK